MQRGRQRQVLASSPTHKIWSSCKRALCAVLGVNTGDLFQTTSKRLHSFPLKSARKSGTVLAMAEAGTDPCKTSERTKYFSKKMQADLHRQICKVDLGNQRSPLWSMHLERTFLLLLRYLLSSCLQKSGCPVARCLSQFSVSHMKNRWLCKKTHNFNGNIVCVCVSVRAWVSVVLLKVVNASQHTDAKQYFNSTCKTDPSTKPNCYWLTQKRWSSCVE